MANPSDELVVFQQKVPGVDDENGEGALDAILMEHKARFASWRELCESKLGTPDATHKTRGEWVWELHPDAGALSAWERGDRFLFVASCQAGRDTPLQIVLGFREPMDPDERMELE
ncbi:hypothetical protein FHW69_001583 [Luteibacter sp. Sphag1AF]|uniref:hypothetical protein n=1 Tax=Luteibacter sp. Sphag1AF TaxID=2587031 RepID=UPI00161D307C|nr:hypothetical protein [Luteibacter sp. Sphag1AF]MBB3226982.1 hypothetical protein [Luteibacter sp. Sphag1AF]